LPNSFEGRGDISLLQAALQAGNVLDRGKRNVQLFLPLPQSAHQIGVAADFQGRHFLKPLANQPADWVQLSRRDFNAALRANRNWASPLRHPPA
jgi:hypothetical protein